MIIKIVTTLMLSLGLVFGGVIAPIHAHAENIATATSCCADGGPGDTWPW